MTVLAKTITGNGSAGGRSIELIIAVLADNSICESGTQRSNEDGY